MNNMYDYVCLYVRVWLRVCVLVGYNMHLFWIYTCNVM